MAGAPLGFVRRYGPGLLALAGLGGASRVVGPAVGVSPLLLAVGVGVVVSARVGRPELLWPGADLHKLLLETGIVLLGAQLSLGKLAATAPVVVGLALGVVLVGACYAELLSRTLFDIRRKPGSLLAAGASVCGVSAVIAVAGSIDASERDVAFAATTVLLFDAVTLVAFPVAGDLLGLPGKAFGVWAGLSMFSTGPVAAAGFAHSAVAGQWATVTKLARNAMLGLVVVGYSLAYSARASNRPARERVSPGALWAGFPKFVVGFGLVAVAASLGLFGPAELRGLERATEWLFTMAFVGLGLDIDLRELTDTGAGPVTLVALHLLTVSLFALGAVLLLVG